MTAAQHIEFLQTALAASLAIIFTLVCLNGLIWRELVRRDGAPKSKLEARAAALTPRPSGRECVLTIGSRTILVRRPRPAFGL